MNRLIYTYSLVKTLYEQGKDYIDSFWPFVLKVMPRDKTTLNLSTIQKGIRDNSGLDIPQYSLKSIITRAKRKGYMTQKKGRFWLTAKGDNYLDALEPESAVERRINELLEDIRNYLNEQLGLSLTLSGSYDIVLSFIHENIDSLLEFCNPDSSIIALGLSRRSDSRYDSVLVSYFQIADQRKSGHYQTLTDIVYGSVISTAASKRDIAGVNKKFAHTKIFLDSNYLFSILDFHFPEFGKPAKELLVLLKFYKFEVRAFDFTLDEMVRVLRGYSREQDLFVPDVRVNSIFSSLKNQGLTTEDVREFITKIEDKIWELGVKIEPTAVELGDYKPPKDEYRAKLSHYKPDQGLYAQNHDLAAIEKIREIRKAPKREIESSRALFLTSDLGLCKFDFFEMRHREKATVCEVISDKLLTNILWLKNPAIIKDIPLKSIIAIHSHEMFIDRRIWRRFCENIRKLKQEGRISDKDISMLFYDHRIEKALEVYDDSQTDKITSELILEQIQSASKLIDEETKKKLEEQREIFEKKLTQVELDKKNALETRLSAIKEKLKVKAVRKAKRRAVVKMCIPALIFVGIFIYFLLTRGWARTAGVILGIASVVGILSFLGIKVNILNIRKRLQDKAFQRIYRKELSEIALEEDFGSRSSKEKPIHGTE